MVLLATEATARIIGVNLGSITEQLWRSRPELRHRVRREWSKDHYQDHRRERTTLVGIPRGAAALDPMIMATIAPVMVVRLTTPALIIPVPIVVATAVPNKTPARFTMEAIDSAQPGDSDRVPTTVAIAFGASVHPLTNSAARTRTMIASNCGNSPVCNARTPAATTTARTPVGRSQLC